MRGFELRVKKKLIHNLEAQKPRPDHDTISQLIYMTIHKVNMVLFLDIVRFDTSELAPNP